MCKTSTFALERDKQPPFAAYMKADGYIIKLERFNQGMTQKELAKKASVCLSTVIKAEQCGSISPRSHKAIKDALQLD